VALAQFIRSIQSFDSRFDDGLVAVNGNMSMPFPNFTLEENAGKELFLFSSTFDPNGERVGGGAGCQRCHRAPEFDIATNALNNGHVTSLDGTNDFTNTRAPSLRDLFDPDGIENGPMMHDGAFSTFDEVLEHYNNIPDVLGNTTLDPRLNPQGNPQKLNLTAQEKVELTAFLKTLTGYDIYTDPKWSDPFEPDGSLDLTGIVVAHTMVMDELKVETFPNPVVNTLTISGDITGAIVEVMNISGQVLQQFEAPNNQVLVDVQEYPAGVLLVRISSHL
jgi:cytochrome c peroxidase